MIFLITWWRELLIAALFAASALLWHEWRGEVKAFDAFKDQIEINGKVAQELRKIRIDADRKTKEDNDREHDKADRNLALAYADASKRMRDRTPSSLLRPATSTPAGGGEKQITFDRAAFDSGVGKAMDNLRAGVEGILRRGDQAISDLKLTVSWALSTQHD